MVRETSDCDVGLVPVMEKKKKGRKKAWVGVSDCSTVLRKFWPSQWYVPETKFPSKGVLHVIGKSLPYNSHYLQALLGKITWESLPWHEPGSGSKGQQLWPSVNHVPCSRKSKQYICRPITVHGCIKTPEIIFERTLPNSSPILGSFYFLLF